MIYEDIQYIYIFSNNTSKQDTQISMAMFTNNRPGMRRLVDRDDENTPVMRDNESVILTFPNVEFSFSATEPIGNGKLFVTSQRFVWLSDSAAYDFDVRFIMLHAISKDTATYPKPCVYCQLDVEQCGDEDDEDAEPDECYFAPTEDDSLMSIFEGFSQAAQMNPDPEEEEAEAAGGVMQYSTDDFIFNEEEVMAGAQQAQLADWEAKFQFPVAENLPGQFADSEEPASKIPKTDA